MPTPVLGSVPYKDEVGAWGQRLFSEEVGSATVSGQHGPLPLAGTEDVSLGPWELLV